jgi:hypothetical protein
MPKTETEVLGASGEHLKGDYTGGAAFVVPARVAGPLP